MPKSTLALEVPPFAVMMSRNPSRSTSPKVTEVGLDPVPVAKLASVLKVPLPLPNITLMLSEVPFAVIISSMPSLSTSPNLTDTGAFPVAKVACAANEGKAVMDGKPTKFKPMVPVPVIPVTLTV